MFIQRTSCLVILCSLVVAVYSTGTPRSGSGAASPARPEGTRLTDIEKALAAAQERIKELESKQQYIQQQQEEIHQQQKRLAEQEEELKRKAAELEAARQAALEAERAAARQVGYETERPSGLPRSETFRWRGGFVDFSSPKVFEQVCDYKKVQAQDEDRHVKCREQCVLLSLRVQQIQKEYPQMVGLKNLAKDCSDFIGGVCDKSYTLPGKRHTSLCTCYTAQKAGEELPRTHLASYCRAHMTGSKIFHNVGVATKPIRNQVSKWHKSWQERRRAKKAAKAEKAAGSN
nr:PREDICTED: uncharacterized protein LOC109037712 [Bemisia tabaci]